MRRRFRFRGRPRTNFRRARQIVRQVSGIMLAKRMNFSALTLPDVTTVDFDNELSIDLLVCQEAMNEELESDGTNVAQIPLYSRILSMRLNLMVHGMATGSIVRWMLVKDPDGEDLVTNLATQFHESDDTPTLRELRKYTLAKGFVFVNPNNQASTIKIFVKRKAWARCSPMRENDTIRLVLAKDAAGTTGSVTGFGTIYVRANA